MSVGLPTGEVTLLFTDVEGSTRLWEIHGERMLEPLADHDAILEGAVTGAGGVLQRSRAEGDSGFAVFTDPRGAIEAAIALQVGMAAHPWPTDLAIRTRAAIHTGTVEVRGDTYYGPVVNRCVKLRALAHGAQTILSKATVDAVGRAGGPPAEVGFTDKGTHRLKDLAVPERVYELAHPVLRCDFPPLRSPDIEQHNLPEVRGRFVGRAQEQRGVSKALEAERLVTLVGTGGVGKTRMALEVAWARVGLEGDDAHEGTWFADLTGARSDDDVDAVLAAAVGVREQPGRALIETVTDHLGEHAALVVLDNCEHVMEPARRVARALLERCPNLRLLATSREHLGLDREHHRPVAGLPLADSVELFFERSGLGAAAREGEPGEAAERLCDRLDGIPFAIEIAAARAQALGPAAVEEGVLRAQVEEAGTSVLQATLSWSFGLLDAEEQVLFRRLGVFAGAFPLDAAEAVTSFDPIDSFDVLDLVSALVERSLVHRSDGGYRQLVVVREWAQELAERAEELDDLAARHLQWCLDLALGGWTQGLDERQRVDRLRLAADDLLASLDREFEGDLASTQVHLATALEEFWWQRGAYAEGRAHLERVLRRGAGFRSHRAVVHRSAGRLANAQGDLAAAQQHFERSRALLEEIVAELAPQASPHLPKLEEHLVATLVQLSEVARLRGQATEAVDLATDAVARSEATAPGALIFLAHAEHARGDAAAADRHLRQALASAEEAGDDGLAADCLRSLGLFARQAGDVVGAELHYRRALVLDRRVGTEIRIALSLLNLADLLVLVGRDATGLLDEGITLARALADPAAEAQGLSTLADIAAAIDPAEAVALHRAAFTLLSPAGTHGEGAVSRLRIAALVEMEGDLDVAASETTTAAETFSSLGDDRGEVEARAQLARIEARRGRLVEARGALGAASRLSDRTSAVLEWPGLLEAAAWVAVGTGRRPEALGLLAAAATERDRLGVVAPLPAQRAREGLLGRLAGVEPAAEPPEMLLERVVQGV